MYGEALFTWIIISLPASPLQRTYLHGVIILHKHGLLHRYYHYYTITLFMDYHYYILYYII